MKKVFILLAVVALCFAGCKSAVEDVVQVETQSVTQEAGLFTDSQTFGVSYYIQFDANGGEGAMQPQKIDGSTIKLNKNTFTCSNAQFLGWARQPDGEVVYSDEETINFPNYPQQVTHLNLYACWGGLQLQSEQKTAITETWVVDSGNDAPVAVATGGQSANFPVVLGDSGNDAPVAVATPNSN